MSDADLLYSHAESISLACRLLAANDRSANSIAESSTSDCTTSMKHLIAVAQAKRREAHLQGHSHDRIFGLVSSPAVARERSPSPLTVVQDISALTLIQKDNKESLSSPSTTAQNCVTVGYVEPEERERGVSPGGLPPQGSLSGGTEAAVARDTLEGMIETLSRTKESIGRATRLAIDCAKYGIANEVRWHLFLLQSFALFPFFHSEHTLHDHEFLMIAYDFNLAQNAYFS